MSEPVVASGADSLQAQIWTVKRTSKDHSYVLEGDKWIATASNENAKRIAEWHNRETRQS